MMFHRQQKDWRTPGVIALAAGATLGVATAVFMGIRSRRARLPERSEVEGELLELENHAVQALSADEIVGSMPLEVEAIATGIIELTGEVETEEIADRAVELAQSVPGVRTVLNRMDVVSLERQLSRSRARAAAGEPAYRESHWYGVGVGTGRRRQSPTTDPDRPSDRIDMVTREYEAERRNRGEDPPSVPGAGRDSTPL